MSFHQRRSSAGKSSEIKKLIQILGRNSVNQGAKGVGRLPKRNSLPDVEGSHYKMKEFTELCVESVANFKRATPMHQTILPPSTVQSGVFLLKFFRRKIVLLKFFYGKKLNLFKSQPLILHPC